MHILDIPDSPEVAASGKIKPGKYVCVDNNAAEFLLLYQDLKPTLTPYRPGLHLENDRILIVGTIAHGDAILLTPVLRELKKRNPKAEIDLCCFDWSRQILLGLPYVSGFVEYPPKLEVLQDYGKVLMLEGAVEFNLLAKSQHMTDRFAQHLGVVPLEGKPDWTDNKKPEITLSGDEKEWVLKTFPRKKGKRRLAIQVQAGVRVRTYPFSLLAMPPQAQIGSKKHSMIQQMIFDGWEVALMGAPGEFTIESLPAEVTDMTRFGLTFRQSAAFLTTCDAFLGPDSSLLHVAGTLDVPAVGLYGPYPWKLRTAYYKSVHALNGNNTCPIAPCFHVYHNGLPLFPPGAPCERTGACMELAAIDPERIRAKLEQLAPRVM